MNLPKLGMAVIWLACLASFLTEPESTAGRIGRIVFWVLVVVHAIECAAFYRLLKRAPGETGPHLAQTFLFGMFHIKDVQLGLDSETAKGEGP